MNKRPKRWLWFGLPCLLLAVHAGIVEMPSLRLVGSDSLLLLCAVLACVACFWRARQLNNLRVGLQWYLAGIGMALWAGGQAIYTYIDVHQIPQTVALNSDLLFFLYGVPFLLAFCSVVDQPRLRSLLITDLVQALVVAWLVESELFPASHGVTTISTAHVYSAYNVENLLLAGAVGLRLFTGARGAKLQFYRVTFAFMALYALVALPMNYLNEFYRLPTGTLLDLLWDLPFLLLAGLAAWLPVVDEEPSQAPVRRSQRIILHSMPVLITAVVLVMGTILVRYDFLAGLLAVLIGLGSYSLRNSLLEMRYLETQRKLTESEAALQIAMERFQELSYIDPLTKVANRRQFEETLNIEWNRTMRRGAPLSLLMMDLDHFKLLNDTYGHLRGDDCLMISAQTLTSRLKRAGEMLARYGGEEFAAVLPDLPADQAAQLAENLRVSIANLGIENRESPNGGCLTVSIGVATCYPSADSSVEALLAQADQSLYAAKQTGRNRVVGTHDAGNLKSVRNFPQAVTVGSESIPISRRPRA
ncbi:MAG: diguanylate cyclase domain-containing protein [Acidobacteriaceae bacterium]